MHSRLLACFAVSLLALAGCDAIMHAILEDDLEPPVKNESGVLEVGQQFGEAIQKENYPAAYQLLTSSRRAEQTLEQFTANCQQQRQDYFDQYTPTKVECYAYMLFQDELGDWEGVPADVKYESLLGVCAVTWELAGPDSQTDDEDPFTTEVDVIVSDENGQPKIAYIDWEDGY